MNKRRMELEDLRAKDTRPVSVDVSCMVYNHGNYLRQALDSILMQETDFPVRIIIHDDASTDDSAAVILEYKKRYPQKIVAVIEEVNLYQNGRSVWAKMFPYFTAKYIAYCEGDDYWLEKDKLQKQVDYLEQNPDCEVCYHNILPVDKDGNYSESGRQIYTHLEEGDYTKYEIRHGLLKSQTASMVKWNYNPWLTEEDKAIYAQAKCNGDRKQLAVNSAFGRIHYLPDVMAAYRFVIDQGDSWSARQNQVPYCERFLGKLAKHREVCRLYEYFHDEKIYQYNHIIDETIAFYRMCRRRKLSVTEEEKRRIRNAAAVPFYAYAVYVPIMLGRSVKLHIRKLFRKT